MLAQPFLTQAQKNYSEGNYFGEIAAFSKAIELLPDSPLIYYNRGGAKRLINDFNGAIGDYSKAITLRPTFIDALAARAVAKTYINDIDGAQKDYLLCIKADAAYAIAYHNYALLIYRTDVDGAIEWLSKAIHFNKKYTSAYLTRAKLYRRLEQKEKACDDFRKAEILGSDEAKIERKVYCK